MNKSIRRNQKIIILITIAAVIATVLGFVILIQGCNQMMKNPEQLDSSVKTVSEFVNHVDSVYNSTK